MNIKYIAGFFDGEGSIVHIGGRVRLQISQTNKRVLMLIQDFFGFGVIYKLKKRKIHWKNAWVYVVTNNRDSRNALKKMIMHLVVKKQTAIKKIKYLNKWFIEKRKWQKRSDFATFLVKKGLSYRQIEEKTGISRQTICNKYKKVREAA